MPVVVTTLPNHSHVCGINENTSAYGPVVNESFPRMWDQRLAESCDRVNKRIIPTYVGSTESCYRLKRHDRIIPTYVGSTPSLVLLSGLAANHSHVCGINNGIVRMNCLQDESFPRMWDQLRLFGSAIIILPNHSHVCGINQRTPSISRRHGESFPRMWDQRLAESCDRVNKRIIPTYVGSTCRRTKTLFFGANHSHVCGINRFSRSAAIWRSESFPRMWDQQFHIVLLKKW